MLVSEYEKLIEAKKESIKMLQENIEKLNPSQTKTTALE